MKHKHLIFLAFDEWATPGEISEPKNATEVTVNDAQTEEQALTEVKKILKRNIYLLRKVWECTSCFYQDRQVRAMEKIAKEHGI